MRSAFGRLAADGIGGVGIDLQEVGALRRFDETAIARAAARLLSPSEQNWCSTQPALTQALVIVLCCREAAFKCCPGAPAVPDLVLRMAGGLSAGHAEWAGRDSVEIRIAWQRKGDQVLAVAVAGLPGTAAGVLSRLGCLIPTNLDRGAAWRRSS